MPESNNIIIFARGSSTNVIAKIRLRTVGFKDVTLKRGPEFWSRREIFFKQKLLIYMYKRK